MQLRSVIGMTVPPETRDSKERCVWRVHGTDGVVIGQGAFYEADYESAVSRAKADAAPYLRPGTTLSLEVGTMAILTLRA